MVEAIRQGDIPGVQLRTRHPLPATTEEAWRWLTEQSLLELWLADRVRRVAGAAGAEALELEDREGTLRERAEVLRVDPPRERVLSFRQLDSGWQAATRLTLALTPQPTGCEAMVFHEGFERLSLSQCLTAWEAYRKRWRAALSKLAQALAAQASSG